MTSLPLKISKMSGAGNTFAVLDARSGSAWSQVEKDLSMSRADFAKMICDPVQGICADGFLLIEEGSQDIDYKWDFYNSDGSTAEMCGNAARCAARYCHEVLKPATNSQIRFLTGAGLVDAQIVKDHQVCVLMPEARFLQREIALKTRWGSFEKFALVNTGVPHLVQKVQDISTVQGMKEMAREVRSHHDLKPAGANVTFYAEEFKGQIKAVTYERGVENYTLACGTGAVAAALVYTDESKSQQVNVEMPGGSLRVTFPEGEVRPLMLGEAIFIGEFQYNLEVMK
ncbi:MAG: diaminopimelate epimerase [Bdellovibrio sp.]